MTIKNLPLFKSGLLQGIKNKMKVNVAEYRRQIGHLERIYHVDRHACVGSLEIKHCAMAAKRVRDDILSMVCPRAKNQDHQRKDTIVQKAKSFINQTL